MNKEEGSSSHGAQNQDEILAVDPATQYLLKRVRNIKDDQKHSPIYVVPDVLTEVNSSSFIPRVVSIGPLHSGLTNLKSVESKKPADLKELLDNCVKEQLGAHDEILEKCVKKVRASLQEIRRYYFGMKTYTTDNHQLVSMIGLKKYTDDELVQIMVMDGCFILQFIDNLSKTENLSSKDRFSTNRLRSQNIALDLVLLENQIPFFVLQNIYELTLGKFRSKSTLITMLSANLLKLINPFSESLKDENVSKETIDHDHILGLLHKFYKPDFDELPRIEEIPTAHSAVELDKVGVKIRPNKKLTWPMAMELKYSLFLRRPTLRMPVVRIDNSFEVVLRNLIAYEQYSPVKNYVTSYAMAMHMLAATPADIAKLGKSGVINVSHLGSYENASDMIRRICKNVTLQDFYYIEPWKNIAEYYDSYWPKHFGVFKRTYTDSPWKVIGLFAAVTVFLITVAQFFRQVVFRPFL